MAVKRTLIIAILCAMGGAGLTYFSLEGTKGTDFVALEERRSDGTPSLDQGGDRDDVADTSGFRCFFRPSSTPPRFFTAGTNQNVEMHGAALHGADVWDYVRAELNHAERKRQLAARIFARQKSDQPVLAGGSVARNPDGVMGDGSLTDDLADLPDQLKSSIVAIEDPEVRRAAVKLFREKAARDQQQQYELQSYVQAAQDRLIIPEADQLCGHIPDFGQSRAPFPRFGDSSRGVTLDVLFRMDCAGCTGYFLDLLELYQDLQRSFEIRLITVTQNGKFAFPEHALMCIWQIQPNLTFGMFDNMVRNWTFQSGDEGVQRTLFREWADVNGVSEQARACVDGLNSEANFPDKTVLATATRLEGFGDPASSDEGAHKSPQPFAFSPIVLLNGQLLLTPAPQSLSWVIPAVLSEKSKP